MTARAASPLHRRLAGPGLRAGQHVSLALVPAITKIDREPHPIIRRRVH